MSGAAPSIPGNPRELYQQFKAGGGTHQDFALPSGMGNTGAIVAKAIQPLKEGGKSQVEFRCVAPTGMSNPSDILSSAEIQRRVQMTASILENQEQVQ